MITLTMLKKISLCLWILTLFLLTVGLQDTLGAKGKKVSLLNVSYDPTRELYREVNAAFTKQWKEKTGDTIIINQSHGGSGKQARAIIDGLDADVATLALAYDVDQLFKKGGLISQNWQSKMPHNSTPYVSTIVFLVRAGNPKQIKDWDDLAKPGVSVVTPNPKTSGGARWNYLAAWGFALKKFSQNEPQAIDFVSRIFKNVSVLDTGARAATTTFSERGLGDVLITWENEAFLALHEIGVGRFEMVTPSVSILTEPPVTVVDKNVSKRRTLEAAQAYLNFLYTEEGQEIIAKHYFRPRSEKAAQKYAGRFPKLALFTIEELGGWAEVQSKHFADGGLWDQIYAA